MNKKIAFWTATIQVISWAVIIWLFARGMSGKVPAYALFQNQEPPLPFLGPIYYGQEVVLNVFDHNMPCASVSACSEDPENFFVLHHNGVQHNPVTITPVASPLPGITPTPAPTYYPNNYGYDEHAGIDYNMKYEPVLAAADGEVTVADWHFKSNHKQGFGLYVQIDHGVYSTLYAHLSVAAVQVGENITADPDSRNGIIGISGNTGSVFGCGGDAVEENPLCGAHLHFEAREGTGYRPVNPYGWISTPEVDPWPPVPTFGAVSYPLWATPPAVSGTPQYPVGPTVSAPLAPVAARTIDDADPEFDFYPIEPVPCMEYRTTGGLYGSFRYAEVNTPTYCEAWWHITPNELTQPGWYDVYVHIPEITWTTQISLTRGAEYKIISELKPPQTAIVVQAAYPNNSHPDRWVYIGRYEFAMEGANEYIRVSNQTFTSVGSDDGSGDGEGFIVAADAIQLAPVNPGQPITPTPTPTFTPTATPAINYLTAFLEQSSDDAGPYGASLPSNTGVPCTAANPSYALNHAEVYFGRCGDGTSIVSGFRFTSVSIPDGVIITQAILLFTGDDYPASNILDVAIHGELVGDSVTFSETNRPSDRSPLSDPVNWHIAEEWDLFEAIESPNIAPIIQAIVDLPEWEQGDSITIITKPASSGTNHRRIFAWDRESGSGRAAKLLVWYAFPSTPTPTPTITPTPTPSNTGFMSPNASVAGSGGDNNGYETQPHNAYNDGGPLAGDKKSGAGTIIGDPCVSAATDKHIFRDFNITIPTNATIRGIEVRLDASNSMPSALLQICVQLSWDGGITWTSSQVTPVLTNSELTYILGSPTYLWGRSWLPGELANSSFRLRVVDFANSTSTDFYLDWVAVKVHYQ